MLELNGKETVWLVVLGRGILGHPEMIHVIRGDEDEARDRAIEIFRDELRQYGIERFKENDDQELFYRNTDDDSYVHLMRTESRLLTVG